MNAPPERAGARHRVLMVAPTMFFADYGAHVRILEEATSLRQLGHEITILAYPNGRDIAGLKVVRCPGVPFNYRIIVGSSRHKIYLDVMLALKGLGVMAQLKPDIIHAHLHEGGLIGAILSRLWRVPLVFDFQGSMTSEMVDHRFLSPQSALYRPLRWLEGWIDRCPDAVITSSHNAAELLQAEFGCAKEGVYTITDCVDPGIFRPNAVTREERVALRARYGIPPDAEVVLYLGILQDYQGIPHLINAAKRVTSERPNTFFLILGFPNLDRYRALAQQLGVAHRVFLPGPVPYEQTPSHLAIGDVATAPKLSATEGAAKLLYYMSTALPVVAFDTPVSREYLGEWGLHATPGDAESLAEEILILLNAPEEAQARGRQLRERVLERYTWTQGGERITEIYKKVCPRPQGVL
jgi:glycosyltransferase involved in cell wall biosynthesis